MVIVNTINNYIYVKSAPYKGLVEKAFANTNEDIFVKTAMEREFVNMENKNIFVPPVTAVGCVSKINVKIFVRFVARLNLIIKWLNTI